MLFKKITNNLIKNHIYLNKNTDEKLKDSKKIIELISNKFIYIDPLFFSKFFNGPSIESDNYRCNLAHAFIKIDSYSSVEHFEEFKTSKTEDKIKLLTSDNINFLDVLSNFDRLGLTSTEKFKFIKSYLNKNPTHLPLTLNKNNIEIIKKYLTPNQILELLQETINKEPKSIFSILDQLENLFSHEELKQISEFIFNHLKKDIKNPNFKIGKTISNLDLTDCFSFLTRCGVDIPAFNDIERIYSQHRNSKAMILKGKVKYLFQTEEKAENDSFLNTTLRKLATHLTLYSNCLKYSGDSELPSEFLDSNSQQPLVS